MAGSTTIEELPQEHYQVFISGGGAFLSNIVWALELNDISFITRKDDCREEAIFRRRLEKSEVVIFIFSENYTESIMRERELAMISDCVEKGQLVAFPFFYYLDQHNVKAYREKFGNAFRDMRQGTKTNIEGIEMDYGSHSDMDEVLREIVEEVERLLHGYSYSKIEKLPPQQHQVYISFRGDDVEFEILHDIVTALESNDISVITNKDNVREETIFKRRIQKSKVAIVIFSGNYTESIMRGKELAMISNCVEKGQLVAFPFFYDLDQSTVKTLRAKYGNAFRMRESDATMANIKGIVMDRESDMNKVLREFLEEVERLLEGSISQMASSVDPLKNIDTATSAGGEKVKTLGIKQGLKELGNKLDDNCLDLSKIRSHLGMIIACLLLLFFCLKHIAFPTTPLLGEGGVAIDRIVVDEPKVLECIPAERTENPRDNDSDFPTDEYGARSSSSDAKTNSDLLDRTLINSPMYCKVKPPQILKDKSSGIKQSFNDFGEKLDLRNIGSLLGTIIGCLLLTFFCLQYFAYKNKPSLGEGGSAIDIIVPQIQVFINFRGDELRKTFVGYLVSALRKAEVNVFIDNHERRGEDLNTLFKRIEDSGIAIVVLSTRYTESKWCLEELVKIKERVEQGLLKVLPIFYKVSPTDVKKLRGEFGDNFRDQKDRYRFNSSLIKAWKEAIEFVSKRHALVYDDKSRELEIEFVGRIVKDVLEILQSISTVESGQSSVNICGVE